MGVTPDTRRSVRTVVQSVAVLTLLGFLWFWAERLNDEGLLEAARWALAIIALFVAYTGAENFRRAKFEAQIGGNTLGGELNGDDGGEG